MSGFRVRVHDQGLESGLNVIVFHLYQNDHNKQLPLELVTFNGHIKNKLENEILQHEFKLQSNLVITKCIGPAKFVPYNRCL